MLKREGKKTEKELTMIWGLFCKKCAFLNTTISPTLHHSHQHRQVSRLLSVIFALRCCFVNFSQAWVRTSENATYRTYPFLGPWRKSFLCTTKMDVMSKITSQIIGFNKYWLLLALDLFLLVSLCCE